MFQTSEFGKEKYCNFVIMKRILWILMLVSITAYPMRKKRAEKQIAKISIQHPDLIAQYCAQSYPPVERTTTTIEYRQGERDTIFQAEYVDCDTIYGTDRIIRVPYLVKTRDTLFYRDSVFVENKAEISRLKIERDNYFAETERLKNKAKNLLYGGFLVGALLVFVLAVWLKKIF